MSLRERVALVLGLGLLAFVPVGYLVGGEDFRRWWYYGSAGRPIYEEGLEKLAEIERVQDELGVGSDAVEQTRAALPAVFWQSEAWPDHEWWYVNHSGYSPTLGIGEYAPSEDGGDEFELRYYFDTKRWSSNS